MKTNLFFLVVLVFVGLGLSAQPTINSVDIIDSSCPNNGEITINATGNGALSYTITSGPVCTGLSYPINNGTTNNFQSLCPGDYDIEVVDNDGTTPETVTVGGSYVEPDLVLSGMDPLCPGATDGELTATVTDGLAPYDYEVTGGTIAGFIDCTDCTASETFTGLGGGVYTVQVFDDCGSLQTRMFTLTDPAAVPLSLTTSSFYPRRLDDCVTATYLAVVSFSNTGVPDYSWEVYDGSNSLVSTSGGFVSDNFWEADLPIAGEPYTFEITDACGTMATFSDDWTDDVSTFTQDELCTTFDFGLTGLNTYSETYTVTASDGMTNYTASLNTSFGSATFDDLPYGSYTITLTTACGIEMYMVTNAGPDPVNFTFNTGFGPSDCVNRGDASIRLSGDGKPWTWTMTAFPTGYDGVTTRTITSTGTFRIDFNDLIPGDYTIDIVDDCGNMDQTMFTITQVSTLEFTPEGIPGCGLNDGTIEWSAISNEGSPNMSVRIRDSGGNILITQFGVLSGELNNLPPGDYTVELVFGCGDIPGPYTVTVPDYTQPGFDPLFGVPCSDGSIAILGSGTGGREPYDFELFNKDVDPGLTTPLQTINDVLDFEFSGLISGVTYTVRVIDDCGNGDPADVTVQAGLEVAAEVTTCTGGIIHLETDFLAGVAFDWTKDGGPSLSSTNSLEINAPVSAADAGTYTVTATLGTCVSDMASITLTEGTVCGDLLPIELSYFRVALNENKKDVSLIWETASELNNDRFEIERSSDAYNWEVIYTVSGAGNAQASNKYTAIDREPISGINYYRLKQIDFDGKYSYSSVRSVQLNKKFSMTIAPTVLNNGESLSILNIKNGLHKISLVDIHGKIVANFNPIPVGLKASLELPQLISGLYFVQLEGEDFIQTYKIIIQ